MTRSNGEQLRTGATLARYRIIERIGAGGMGEVYRARDLDLERDVAVKVLPSDVTGSEERVRRFVQEAKSASGLNHPNIVSIHEIGVADVDGARHHFIAMELVEGDTLRARIHKPHRDVKSLLGHAAQAADALAKAHAAGIVHRDLKPDNLMVTRDGFAKVLDFGLAKLIEARPSLDASQTQVRPDTRDGVVLGTIGYMSPEQAQGLPVDARSDIFSLGCILYEIATGERPFKGSSQVDVLHAIVHNEPVPVTDLNPTVPPELRRIIRRCLAKDPDQRFQSMKDLANTLRDLVDEYDQLTPGSGSTTTRIAAVQTQKRTLWPWAAVIAVLLIAAIAMAVLWRRRAQPAPAAAQAEMKIAPVTSNGRAYAAAISPDARYIAYAQSDAGDDSMLRVRQRSTSSEIVIRPQSRERVYGNLAFSRDGELLYALERRRGSNVRTLVMIPTLGGEPRELIADVDSRSALSPDGKSVAFVRRESTRDTSIFVADASGTSVRRIATLKEPDFFAEVSWSPDGQWLACSARTTTGGLQARIELMTPEGKQMRRLTTDRWFFMAGPFEWLPDGSGILVSGQVAETGANQVWLVSYPEGRARRLTNDLNSYWSVSVTADGKSFITVQDEARPRIWRVDLGAQTSTPITDERANRTPTRFVVDAAGNLIYPSFDGGSADIWSVAADASTPARQLTNDPGAEFSPVLPRDGSIVFYEREDDKGLELWSMDPRGSAKRRIAKLPAANADLSCSPDGKYVIMPAAQGLLRVSTADGAQKILTPVFLYSAVYSPDGALIAAMERGPTPGREQRILIFDANTGAIVHESPRDPDQNRFTFKWSPDGRHVVFIEHHDGVDNLYMRPIAGGAAVPLTKFTERATTIDSFAYTPDGKALFVGRASSSQNVVLVSNFR